MLENEMSIFVFCSSGRQPFCTADRLKTEIISRTGLKETQMFSNEYLIQLR